MSGRERRTPLLSRTALGALAAACLGATLVGCVEFNVECLPPIENPEQVVTTLPVPVAIDRGTVRGGESPIGNVIADAYWESFSSDWDSVRPDIALVNAGMVRERGLCVTRTRLPAGELTRGVLRDTIPFSSNELLVVSLSVRELFGILEHAVRDLKPDATRLGGQFLQVSHLGYEVDCAQEPEQLVVSADGPVRNKEGSRVRKLAVTSANGARRVFLRDDIDDPEVAGIRISAVVPSFLVEGGDNFVDFINVSARSGDEAGAVVRGRRYAYETVEAYLSSAEALATLAGTDANPRILLTNCR